MAKVAAEELVASHDWRAPLSARALAVAFLAATHEPTRAADLVRRAGLMGVDAAAMRMALARLTREKIVQQEQRGVYVIGPAGSALDRHARRWAQAEQRVRAWDGRWTMIAVDHLGRSNRRQVRRRERALSLYGFAAGPGGMWVRPDNLALPLPDLAAQMQALGLDPAAVVLGGVALLPADELACRALWPAAAIEAGYRHWLQELAMSKARLAGLPIEAAARETLLLGQAVIRAINRDPLLPGEMVDIGTRDAMVAAMRRYDVIGKACWAALG